MKCKHCKQQIRKGDPYTQLPNNVTTLHNICVDLYIDAVIHKVQKKRIESTKKTEERFKELKAKKSKSDVKNYAWKIFKKFIYLRDSDEYGMCYCISCNAHLHYTESTLHAGHFIPKSKSEFFYFHEDNVHAQCQNCNNFGSHDVGLVFAENVRRKIGDKRFAILEKAKKDKDRVVMTIDDYRKITATYKEKVKQLLTEKI